MGTGSDVTTTGSDMEQEVILRQQKVTVGTGSDTRQQELRSPCSMAHFLPQSWVPTSLPVQLPACDVPFCPSPTPAPVAIMAW